MDSMGLKTKRESFIPDAFFPSLKKRSDGVSFLARSGLPFCFLKPVRHVTCVPLLN